MARVSLSRAPSPSRSRSFSNARRWRAAQPEPCRKVPKPAPAPGESPGGRHSAPAHTGGAAGWWLLLRSGGETGEKPGPSNLGGHRCSYRSEGNGKHQVQSCLWLVSISASSTATLGWRGAAVSRLSQTSTATAAPRKYRRFWAARSPVLSPRRTGEPCRPLCFLPRCWWYGAPRGVRVLWGAQSRVCPCRALFSLRPYRSGAGCFPGSRLERSGALPAGAETRSAAVAWRSLRSCARPLAGPVTGANAVGGRRKA